MSELLALLSDQGIALKSTKPDTDHRLSCPRCDGGTTHEKSLSVTVDKDGGAVWCCFRANCGWKGNIASKRSVMGFKQRAYTLPAEHVERKRAEWVDDYFTARKISQNTLDELDIYSTEHFMPELGKKVECIVFPYRQNSILQRRKYRHLILEEGDKPILQRVVGKSHAQDKDSPPSLFNFDAIDNEQVVWVEGETDLLAIYESGFQSVVTLPDGAPPAPKEGEKLNLGQRLLPLNLVKNRLDEVKTFILAGDNDEVGRAFMSAIEDFLGPRRCKFVTWPKGCKDAGETLMKYGKDIVQAAIESAQFSDKVGFKSTTYAGVAELQENMKIPGLSLVEPLDHILKLPAHGGMIMLTGQPGRGKSSFTNWLVAKSIMKYRWHWAVFAAEGYGPEGAMVSLMNTYAYMQQDHFIHPKLTPQEYDAAHQHVSKFVNLLDAKDRANRRIRIMLENVEWLKCQKPVHGVLIDPWNEVDINTGRKLAREDEHANEILSYINDWSHEQEICVVIAAHPHTIRRGKDGKAPEIDGYSIAGGAPYFNKPDAGFTISRGDEDSEMNLKCWKARYRNWSGIGEASLSYDWKTGMITDPLAQIPDKPPANFSSNVH